MITIIIINRLFLYSKKCLVQNPPFFEISMYQTDILTSD